jgi:hypothetical protein
VHSKEGIWEHQPQPDLQLFVRVYSHMSLTFSITTFIVLLHIGRGRCRSRCASLLDGDLKETAILKYEALVFWPVHASIQLDGSTWYISFPFAKKVVKSLGCPYESLVAGIGVGTLSSSSSSSSSSLHHWAAMAIIMRRKMDNIWGRDFL